MPSSPQGICRDCENRAVAGGYCAAHQKTNRASESRTLFDRYRSADEHRKLYKTARWAAARALVIRRDILCKHEGGCHRAATIVHHVIDAVEWLASGGNFYDTSNLVGWCKPHHDSHTAKTSGFARRKTELC